MSLVPGPYALTGKAKRDMIYFEVTISGMMGPGPLRMQRARKMGLAPMPAQVLSSHLGKRPATKWRFS
jgi:hypothetical protein